MSKHVLTYIYIYIYNSIPRRPDQALLDVSVCIAQPFNKDSDNATHIIITIICIQALQLQ